MTSILITGGAGYIGSEVAHQLIQLGHKLVIIDNLSTGDIRRVPSEAEFYDIDISDADKVHEILEEKSFEAVFHFAAFKQARESQSAPAKYWNNNITKFIDFLNILAKFKISNVVFSSSCSVYGNGGLVNENSLLAPVSTYGWTKLSAERILSDYSRKNNWNFISLRYFNVIGASSRKYSGDYSSQCILPSLFQKMTDGEDFLIFGNDFETKDGTAVRDYIDVRDVASAHVIALDLLESGFSGAVNVSTGKPISVLDVINIVNRFVPKPVRYSVKGRNVSDPSIIWAEPSPELKNFGWKPNFQIAKTIEDHWLSFKEFRSMHSEL
jgi:UDP-glucose 4-epimerase